MWYLTYVQNSLLRLAAVRNVSYAKENAFYFMTEKFCLLLWICAVQLVCGGNSVRTSPSLC